MTIQEFTPLPKQVRPDYKYFVKKGKRLIGTAFTQRDLAILIKAKRSEIEYKFKTTSSFKNIEGYTVTRKPISREEYRNAMKGQKKPKKAKKTKGKIIGVAKEKSLFFNTFQEFYKFK